MKVNARKRLWGLVTALMLFTMPGIGGANAAEATVKDDSLLVPASEVFGTPTEARNFPKDISGTSGVREAISETEPSASDVSKLLFNKGRSLVDDRTGEVKEDIGKRTRTSRTFVRTDGISRVEESRFSVNYLNGKEWLPIDTTLREDVSVRGYSYSMLTNQFKVRLNHEAGNAAISFTMNNQSVTYRPVGMEPINGVVNQDTVIYPGAWTSTDLVYQVQNDELKMELKLLDEKAPKTFEFEMKTQGVQHRINEDQSIDFLSKSGEPVFQIPSFWIQDASSPERRYDRLAVSVAENEGNTVIRLELDDKGLEYPIIIDPSTTAIYNTISSGGSYHLYDNAGRLSQVASSVGTVDYLYDVKGNLIRKSKSNNLLTNGSFELNTGTTGIADGWNNIYTTPQTVSSPVSSGQKAQKLTASNIANGYFTGMSQRVKVDAGKPFIANANLNITELSNANIFLNIDFMNSSGSWISSYNESYSGTTGGKYITFTTNGTVPVNAAYAEVYIMIRANANYGSATLYVDQMNLRYDWEPNLLANPSFESYSGLGGIADGWSRRTSGSTPFIQVVNESVKEGFRSHKVFDSNIPNGAPSGIYQNVKMSGNAAYNLSAIFDNVALTNTKAQLFIDFLNSQHQYIGNNVAENTMLVPNLSLSLSGTTPANTAYAIVYILVRSTGTGGTGTVFADLVNLKYTSTPNKITNAGFEAANYYTTRGAGWLQAGGLVDLVSSPVLNGRRAQKLSGTIPNGYVAFVYQPIKVTAGATYSTSANVYVESLSNARVRYQINFFNAQNQLIGSNSYPYDVVNGSYINIFLNNFTVPANAVYANVLIILEPTAASGSGTIYIDDVKFN